MGARGFMADGGFPCKNPGAEDTQCKKNPYHQVERSRALSEIQVRKPRPDEYGSRYGGPNSAHVMLDQGVNARASFNLKEAKHGDHDNRDAARRGGSHRPVGGNPGK